MTTGNPGPPPPAVPPNVPPANPGSNAPLTPPPGPNRDRGPLYAFIGGALLASLVAWLVYAAYITPRDAPLVASNSIWQHSSSASPTAGTPAAASSSHKVTNTPKATNTATAAPTSAPTPSPLHSPNSSSYVSGAVTVGTVGGMNGCVSSVGTMSVTTRGNPNVALVSADWPTTPEGHAAISFATDNGSGLIMAEAGTYATIPETVALLNDAAAQGVGVVIGVSDYWTKAPDDAVAAYRRQFGADPLEQMVNVAKCFSNHPAFAGIITASRLPASPDTVGNLPAQLHEAYGLVKQVIGDKPVYGNYDAWTAPDSTTRQAFLRLAMDPATKWADHLTLIHYPWPDSPGSTNGGVGTITTTAKDLAAVDPDGWYEVQDGNLSAVSPELARKFKMSQIGATPDRSDMATILDAALNGGIQHVSFNYTEANKTGGNQLTELGFAMTAAVNTLSK